MPIVNQDYPIRPRPHEPFVLKPTLGAKPGDALEPGGRSRYWKIRWRALSTCPTDEN